MNQVKSSHYLMLQLIDNNQLIVYFVFQSFKHNAMKTGAAYSLTGYKQNSMTKN